MVIIVIAVVAVSAFVGYLAYSNAHPTIIEALVSGPVTVAAGSRHDHPFSVANGVTNARVVGNCRSVEPVTLHGLSVEISRLGGVALWRDRCRLSGQQFGGEERNGSFDLLLQPGSSYLLSVTAGCAHRIVTPFGESPSPPWECDDGSETANVSAILTYTK